MPMHDTARPKNSLLKVLLNSILERRKAFILVFKSLNHNNKQVIKWINQM